MHLRRQWSSLDEIIMAAMKRAEPRTREHRIEMWLDDELPSVNVDERALVEVIYMLVDNAAKYSPARISHQGMQQTPAKDHTVRVIVEDREGNTA